MTSEILLPTSQEEAIASFGDGGGLTVLGGGTALMPELAAGGPSGLRVLCLARAGLDGVSRSNGSVTIGAACPISALEELDEPLATAARHVADPEVRAQATVGGNICVEASAESPRGDLQAPLIALAATGRSSGAGGERTEPIENFLASRDGRLLLEVSYPDTSRVAGYAVARRPHAHHYPIMAACAARDSGTTRVAVTGAARTGHRCTSVEQALASGATADDAAARVVDDVAGELRDDALASAWYRERVMPTLVARALAQLEEGSA